MRYLMSTSIIPAGWRGPVEVELISLQGAKRLLKAEFTSAVGHAATAELLTGLFGLEVTHNRVSVSVQPGDEFIAFQLLRRPPEAVVLDLESLETIGYELRLIKFVGEEEILTAAQAKRVLRDALNEITGAMDAPDSKEEAAECVRVLAGAIESLYYSAHCLIDAGEYDDCPLSVALRDAAEELEKERCDCGAEPCEFLGCDSHYPDKVCQSCCKDAFGDCPILCPECGERSAPDLPGDYIERRTRSSCGPETPGHCGACGAKWD